MQEMDFDGAVPLNTPKRKSGYYSTGSAFYDTYHEEDDSDEKSTDNRLQFAQNLQDVRKGELNAMREGYGKFICKEDATETGNVALCLVGGVSGAGKTTLVRQFLSSLQIQDYPTPTQMRPPLVLEGKFEELSGENPLDAFVEALACAARSPNTEELSHVTEIRQKICRKIGGKEVVADLATQLPALGHLLEAPSTSQSDAGIKIKDESKMQGNSSAQKFEDDHHSNQNTLSSASPLPTKASNENAWNQLKHRLLIVVQALCLVDRPTLLCLEDLQWMDNETLDLLETIILDRKELKNFMFIGTYRSDVTLPNSFWTTIKKVSLECSSVQELELNGISESQMVPFVQGAMNIQPDDDDVDDGYLAEVATLASVLHKKTEGNMFFARQVLEELHSKGQLSFSRLTFRWEWDLQSIEVSENVLEFVSGRIKTNCSRLQQRILSTAAYMKSTVDIESLAFVVDMQDVMEDEKSRELTREALVVELDKMVFNGFMTNATGSNEYSFFHDRIKQAAYDLIEEGPNRLAFRRSIASKLYRLSKKKKRGKDWMVYAAADHLNALPLDDGLFMTKLNLDAGRRCTRVASFTAATKYMGFAWEYLQGIPDVWKSRYDLALEVHKRRAEMEFIAGHIEIGIDVSEKFFKNAKTIDETLRTRMLLSKALHREKRFEEAFKVSKEVLRSIGCYPKSKVGVLSSIIRDLLYLKRYFQKHSDEDIVNLPQSNDSRLDAAIDIFSAGVVQAFTIKKHVDFMALTLKSMKLSLDKGCISPSLGVAFLTYYMICDARGEKDAVRYADIGLKMIDRFPDKSALSVQLTIKASFHDTWNRDTEIALKNFKKAYVTGLAWGEFDGAMTGSCLYLDHRFATGYPLSQLDVQYAELYAKAEALQCVGGAVVASTMWEPVRYLRGTAEGVLNPESSVLPFPEDKMRVDHETCKEIDERNLLMIGVYWNHVEYQKKLLDTQTRSLYPARPIMGLILFFTAIACGNVYQQGQMKSSSKKRSFYLKLGRQCATKLKTLCERKGGISWHNQLLAFVHLEATSERVHNDKGDVESMIQKYESAIEMALQQKQIHDAALGAQLLAQQLLWKDRTTDSKLISKYIMLARKLYKEWGASNLVHHLDVQYRDYITTTEASSPPYPRSSRAPTRRSV